MVDFSLLGRRLAVTDESLCLVTGCALGTDVCHWMFKTKVNMVQGQEDGPLNILFITRCDKGLGRVKTYV